MVEELKQQSIKENRQGTGGRGKGQEKVVVEEEVMIQRWLLWLGTFDDGSENYARPQHMKVIEHFVNLQYGCGMQPVVV